MTQSSNLTKVGVCCHDFAYNDTEAHEQDRSKLEASSAAVKQQFLTRFSGKMKTSPYAKTYLLSGQSLKILQSRYAYDTIKSLLSIPHAIVILMVPCRYITHPTVLEYSKVPRCAGSCLQIIPFDPRNGETDDEKAIECLTKYCKVHRIDGFMAFEEEVEFRMRLAAISKRINAR